MPELYNITNTVKLSKYHNLVRLIKQKIDDHNSVSDDYWDVNLINFNTSEWVLNKLLLKMNEVYLHNYLVMAGYVFTNK